MPLDDGSGEYYFWNTATHEATYRRPHFDPAQALRRASAQVIAVARLTPKAGEERRPPPPPVRERVLEWERRRHEFKEDEWEWREKRRWARSVGSA